MKLGYNENNDLNPSSLIDIIESLKGQVKKWRGKYEELKDLCGKDSLTGLYGVNHCEEKLLADVGDFFRSSQNYSVIFMDVNDFRKFNNKYSHDAGDIVLKTLADVLTSNKRENDNVYRRGDASDEFLAIIKGSSLDAEMFAERVLSSFWEKLSEKYPEAVSGLSAGICDLETALRVYERKEGSSLTFKNKQLLADKVNLLADKALISAKKCKYGKEGKGNIVIYSLEHEKRTLFFNLKLNFNFSNRLPLRQFSHMVLFLYPQLAYCF